MAFFTVENPTNAPYSHAVKTIKLQLPIVDATKPPTFTSPSPVLLNGVPSVLGTPLMGTVQYNSGQGVLKAQDATVIQTASSTPEAVASPVAGVDHSSILWIIFGIGVVVAVTLGYAGRG